MLNPNDLAGQPNFVDLLVQCERWDHAKRQASLVTSLLPGPYAHQLLAEVHSFLGEVESARSSAAMAEVPGYGLGRVANVYRRIGDLDGAQRAFDLTGSHANMLDPNAEFYFFIQMAVGNNEAAMAGLEHAIEVGFPWTVARDLHYFSDHPHFDPVRAHPKFPELVRRVAAPLAQR